MSRVSPSVLDIPRPVSEGYIENVHDSLRFPCIVVECFKEYIEIDFKFGNLL